MRNAGQHEGAIFGGLLDFSGHLVESTIDGADFQRAALCFQHGGVLAFAHAQGGQLQTFERTIELPYEHDNGDQRQQRYTDDPRNDDPRIVLGKKT
jgi:hypothetical protein